MRHVVIGVSVFAAAVVAAPALAQSNAPRRIPEIVAAPEPLTAGPAQGFRTFKAEEYAPFAKAGRGAIEGDALLRTRGGQIRSCGGLGVSLWPATPYMLDQIKYIFPAALSGGSIDPGDLGKKLSGVDQRALAHTKVKVCNSQGRFSFRDLPAGAYFVFAEVTWEVPGLPQNRRQQGGVLGRVYVLKDGEQLDVTMTQ